MATASRTLRLVVFDLDYTVWKPEMYQLHGGPVLTEISKLRNQPSRKVLQQARTTSEGKILVDRSQTPIRVFDGAAHSLMEIVRLRKEGHDIYAAAASRTDEPQWAHKCLQHLVLPDGTTTLQECFEHRVVIDDMHDKTYHFEALRKMTGIPFEQMCFYDNEHWNIRCVEPLGVESVYTPDGMTRDAWEQVLKRFHMENL